MSKRFLLLAIVSVMGTPLTTFAAIVFRPCESASSPSECYLDTCQKADSQTGTGWATARCENENGYIGTYAHGNTFGAGFAAAEATQMISFYVENSGTIAFQAKIKRIGGTVEHGAGAFAGTYKVWVMDGDRHTAQVDAWFNTERALEIAADLSLAALGASYGIERMIELCVETPLLLIELGRLGDNQAETITISDHFFAEGGQTHYITVGLRSQASGVAFDWGEAISLGVVEEIRVWGVGTNPQPPTVSGPTEACPGARMDFTIHNDDCMQSASANVIYKIDPGNASYEWTTNPVACGEPVTFSRNYYDSGTYTIEVRTANPFTGLWSVATEYDVTIGPGQPVGGTPDPLVVSQGSSCTSIDVRWRPVEGVEWYEIFRDGDFVTETSDTLYVDTNLNHPPNDPTYGYRIRACNACGCTSSDAEPDEPFMYQDYDGHPKYPPRVPAFQGIRASDGACTLQVQWWEVQDDVPYTAAGRADGYRIYRNTVDNPATATQIGSTTCTTCTTFEDATAAFGVNYYYWISAYNACDESPKPVSEMGFRPSIPAAPTNVTATQGTLCDAIRIDWQGESQWTYNVYRIESGPPVLIAENLSWTIYQDENVTPPTNYAYAVQAYDAQCAVFSEPRGATGWAHGYIPLPEVVSITQGGLCDHILLDWDAASGATSYKVRREDAPEMPWEAVNVVVVSGITNTFYEDWAVIPGAYYHYLVTSEAPACVTTWGATEYTGRTGRPVLPPAQLSASDGKCDKIELRWGRVPAADSYTLYRDDQPIVPNISNPTSGNLVSYPDTGASVNVEHTYHVRANSSCMQSEPSNTDSGCRSGSPPSKPTNLSAADGLNCDYVRVLWSHDGQGGGCGGVQFNIYRNNNDNTPGIVPLATTAAVPDQYDYSFDDHLAESGRQHYYWVSAFNGCGETFADTNPSDPDFDPDPGRLGLDMDLDRTCDGADNCLDVFNPSQRDCNTDAVGDACEANLAYQDCNADHECDGVEIDSCPAGYTSCADCNRNRIPDECEFDCDRNLNPDDCDLILHSDWDQNGNGVIDACESVAPEAPLPDIFGPSSTAWACSGGENNGLLCTACNNGNACFSTSDCISCAARDSLCPNGSCTVAAPWLKNRFLTIKLPDSVVDESAIRVTLIDLPSPHNLHNGAMRWAGPPATFEESRSNPTRFATALLQCNPQFEDWGLVDPTGSRLLSLHSADIIPGAMYKVELIFPTCPNFGNPYCYSDPLMIRTAKWGDLEVPCNPPSPTTQPDMGDIAALLNKFRSAFGAPTKTRALLAGGDASGNITTLNVDLGFNHIAACVDAFVGKSYPYSGPVTCPGDPTTLTNRQGANHP